MSIATFVYFRHRTDKTSGVADLPMLSNSINKSIGAEISRGDVYNFNDLKEADQMAIKLFTDVLPGEMIVDEIQFEDNLEIKGGIRKIYLETK
jgi:hypothetical protein